MKKVQIVLDENKILNDGQYNLQKIYAALDKVFVDKYGLLKGEDGFYLESGKKDDFADFWNAILLLKDQAWFLNNVKTWLWFNSDDSSDPEDFEIENIKEHYLAKEIKKTA